MDGEATGQLTLEASVNREKKFSTGSKEHKQITTAVICFFTKDYCPFTQFSWFIRLTLNMIYLIKIILATMQSHLFMKIHGRGYKMNWHI